MLFKIDFASVPDATMIPSSTYRISNQQAGLVNQRGLSKEIICPGWSCNKSFISNTRCSRTTRLMTTVAGSAAEKTTKVYRFIGLDQTADSVSRYSDLNFLHVSRFPKKGDSFESRTSGSPIRMTWPVKRETVRSRYSHDRSTYAWL